MMAGVSGINRHYNAAQNDIDLRQRSSEVSRIASITLLSRSLDHSHTIQLVFRLEL